MRATNRMNRAIPVAGDGGHVIATGVSSTMGEGYYERAPVVALILIAIIATRLHEVVPFAYRLRPALSVGLVGALLVLMRTQQGVLRGVASHPAMKLLVGLFLWAALSAPWSLWPTAALSSSVTLFLPILLMSVVILACEPSEKNLRLLTFGFVAATAAHGLLLLPGRIAGYRLGSMGSLDPNDLAALMVICFPFSVSMVMQSRGMRRWLAAGAAAVFLTIVVFSGSRGGTIALVVAGLVYVLTAKGSRKIVSLVLLLAVGSLTWELAPESFRSRILTIRSTEEDYNTYAYDGRKQIWARARGYIRDRPVAGVGMNNFSVAEGYHLAAQGLRGKWSTTHNTYLQVTSELGFVGAAFFMGILGLAMVRAFALRRPLKGAMGEGQRGQPEFIAAMAGFAAGAYFLSHAYFYAYYALVMLTFFAYRVRQHSRSGPAIFAVQAAAGPRGHRGFRSLRTAHISR